MNRVLINASDDIAQKPLHYAMYVSKEQCPHARDYGTNSTRSSAELPINKVDSDLKIDAQKMVVYNRKSPFISLFQL